MPSSQSARAVAGEPEGATGSCLKPPKPQRKETNLDMNLDASPKSCEKREKGDIAISYQFVTRSVIVIMIPQKIPGSGKNNPR